MHGLAPTHAHTHTHSPCPCRRNNEIAKLKKMFLIVRPTAPSELRLCAFSVARSLASSRARSLDRAVARSSAQNDQAACPHYDQSPPITNSVPALPVIRAILELTTPFRKPCNAIGGRASLHQIASVCALKFFSAADMSTFKTVR